MTKADIIASVGQSRYDEASRILRKQTTGPDPKLPHEVSPAVWDTPLPPIEQIALFFQLYDDLPSYAMLMYATHVYPDFGERSRDLWWSECFKRVSDGGDEVREPILYALWCDYFENPALVEEVWKRACAHDDVHVVEGILRVSGPVPWPLKAPLYEAAAKDAAWHMPLLEGLAGSAFNAFGDIDPAAARQLLARMHLPADAPGYVELKSRLGVTGLKTED